MLNLVILLGALSGGCETASANAEHLYDSGDDSAAVRQLEQTQLADPDCPDSRWRMAYVRLAEANRQTDPDKRNRLWRLGRELSDRCIANHPRSGGAWFVSALSLGVESTFAGARRRVELSKILRERVGRSLELDPNLAGGWYLLAKWHEGLCSLNFVERGFANLLLGGLPPGASRDSARIYLLKSIALRPNTSVVLLDLAKNLDRAGMRKDALTVCHRAMSLPRLAEGDRRNLDEIAKLRRKLESEGS